MNGGGLDEGGGVVASEEGRHPQERLHSKDDASIDEKTGTA